MAAVWNNTVRNHQMDLAKRTEDLTLKLTLGKIVETKIPGTDKVVYGKAS